jgi:hypothetical protein
MKKFVALMALVAFTFAVQADCGKCTGDKKECDKAKTEGKCAKDAQCSKDGKCQKKDSTTTASADNKEVKK